MYIEVYKIRFLLRNLLYIHLMATELVKLPIGEFSL